MRKILTILMSVVLVLNLGVRAAGAEMELEIPDVEVSGDGTIYVPVILHTALQGDSIGIAYEYDEAVLEACPEFATWGRKGILQDFSLENSGVWAAGQAQNLEGTVCVLAFRIRSGAQLTETKVSCTVTVKNDATKVGSFTAEGRLYRVCDHQYGKWTSQGESGHIRECSLCTQKQAQSHRWNEGVAADHPTKDYVDILTQTCEVCGATRSREIEGQESLTPTQPATEPEVPEKPEYETMPPQTEPPVEVPTVPQPQKQEITGNQSDGGNRGEGADRNESGRNENAGDHSHAGNQEKPGTQQNPGNQSGPANPGQEDKWVNTGSQGNGNNPDPEDPDHTHENEIPIPTERPIAVPVPAATEDHIHEQPQETVHDHEHEAPPAQNMGPSLLALLAAAAAVAGAVGLVSWLVKRRKRK